jgi:hypothetical protein
MLTNQELEYAIDHQKKLLTSIEYGGPYRELMDIYEQWKDSGSCKLHAKLCNLARKYDHYLADRQVELQRGYRFLLEFQFELETGLSLKDVKRYEVPRLSNRALDLLVLYKYKVPYLNFGLNSRTQYYWAVVQTITKHHSCVYCNSVHHTKNSCPILRQKRCFKCRRFGHLAVHCN